MNIIELFDQLEIPEPSNEKTLTAVPLPGYPNFRVGVGVEGCPVLLFSTEKNFGSPKLKSVRLKHLSVHQNVECKVIENNVVTSHTFTLLTFANSDRHLQEYFLRISETLIRSLRDSPTEQHILDTLFKFVEIFRALSDTPKKTVQGLWAELFLINVSRDPKTFLEYWHVLPEEKFDFNANEERIEVKSNINMNRVHFFSSEQLSPPENVQVLVASLLLRQTNGGVSVQHLVDAIVAKVSDELELVEKLHSTICKTLGASLEESITIKYDPEMARDSLRFYRHQDIRKIEADHIPAGVSEVRYCSDLSKVVSIDITKQQGARRLFSKF